MRAGLILTLLLSALVRLDAAEPRPTQQQIDAVRQQHLQAIQKLDWAAADRLDKELKALEARAGTVATTATLSPASSFFSAPSGSPAVPPSGSSSVFSPPTTSSATFTAPSFTPAPAAPAAKNTAPAPRTFTPAAPTVSTPAPKASTLIAPAATFTAPAATTTVTAPAARTMSSFGLPVAAPLSAEEPRPAELPPAVLELRAAESALSKLEEFRMAESQTTRRGTAPPVEPFRSSLVPPPSAVMAPSTPFTFTPTPSVNLTGTSDDLRRKLDDLTRRRSELQLEAERLTKDNVDWEARYNAAKAELARLEAQNQDRNRLQSIRDEIARLDSDSTRLMQEAEASRADQDRRARELLAPRAETSSGLASLMRDRPTVPAFGTPAPTAPASASQPERKGPPTFQSVGSSKPQRLASDGNIVRTGRSGEDTVALQRDLDKLTERREIIMRELDEVQLKFNLAQRELATAGRTGVQSDIDRWTKETAALDARYKAATGELSKIDAETQSKIVAMKGAVSGGDPDTVNPGDSLRLIVAEDDTYNAIYPVKRDGNITVKSVGRVMVGGKHISEAEAAVKAVLEETQLQKATVTLEFVNRPERPTDGPMPTETIVIYLAGEFITPGPLKIPEGVAPTLITTIIRSGGITPSGDLTRTKLLRIENGQGAVEEINVAAILSGNIPPTDIALNPGDIIMIPAFAPVVYVTGNVTKPGTLRLFQDETLTAYAAILRAGGFARFANLKKCTVVRDLGNGEKIQMPLNVKEIQKGLAPDIVLQGKDIVVVPESFFSF
jgi:protein involved in polysaccharide export with SLBB domain